MSYKPFKMKGHTLPGIKQRMPNKTSDGRAGSSAFQKKGCKSPYKNVEEGYNPDGSVDKNSERYKKAMANTKKSDARKAKENELRNTMKTGGDVEARRAKTELEKKEKISAAEKRRRDAEDKKRKTGKKSPVTAKRKNMTGGLDKPEARKKGPKERKAYDPDGTTKDRVAEMRKKENEEFKNLGKTPRVPIKKKKKMKASRTVQLKSRGMYPGDAVFEGSEKSKMDQRITNNVITKKDGKIVTGKKTSKTYTHYPESYKSTKFEEAGKRKKVTFGDTGYSRVTKKRNLGGTKEFKYDPDGKLVQKVKRNKKGEITKIKGAGSSKKVRARKTKDFSKKEKAALANVKTKYIG